MMSRRKLLRMFVPLLTSHLIHCIPDDRDEQDPRRSDSIVAELLGATSPSKFRKLSSPLVGRRGVPIAAVEEASSSSDDDEEEESEEAEPEAESCVSSGFTTF